ncbi:MAG: phosphoribosylaminoimidazolesuccinocarboxamide synthase [Microscillaceae bacterium]|nr:phosphoribosylaminoimidazolesuccinocarboxamide synthase [Microscillaceae bacterium]MDW8460076.1 phosphoribosylaminoimidazolesuccinocarboxamide synthase [Cytophagales bacterium]
MPEVIQETHFQFPNQIDFYRGKVRDVYILPNKLIIVATDRISAFDVILPQAIPYKGQVLNQISCFFLEKCRSILPVWLEETPHPNVAVGKRCQPLMVEMVIRGHLAGSAWRAYQKGQRNFNGFRLPNGLHENDRLPMPIITPTTKAIQGQHDQEISFAQIVEQKIASAQILNNLIEYTYQIFELGCKIAQQANLILADTKYEFGLYNNEIYLIDEVHTPDSSRYFDLVGFEERQEKGIPQAQRSKEMVRQWLIAEGFMGRPHDKIPPMSQEWIEKISQEYISIYEQITQTTFIRNENKNFENFLAKMQQNM